MAFRAGAVRRGSACRSVPLGDNVTQAIGAVEEAPPRERVQNRAILRVSVVAGTWGALLSWFLMVLTGDSVAEASHTAFWLLRIFCFYLGALALWVIYNKALYRLRGPSTLRGGEERTFDKDYFGRPVQIADGVDLTHQHLVLAYEDGRKVYRAPTVDEAQPTGEPAVAAGVKALAAAAAAAGQSSPAPQQEDPSETHAGDL